MHFEVNRTTYDTSTNVGMVHPIVITSMLCDWSIENPRWRPFSRMATYKINLLYKAGPTWAN